MLELGDAFATDVIQREWSARDVEPSSCTARGTCIAGHPPPLSADLKRLARVCTRSSPRHLAMRPKWTPRSRRGLAQRWRLSEARRWAQWITTSGLEDGSIPPHLRPAEQDFDALLYFGPPSSITLAPYGDALCGDAAYLATRLSRIQLRDSEQAALEVKKDCERPRAN